MGTMVPLARLRVVDLAVNWERRRVVANPREPIGRPDSLSGMRTVKLIALLSIAAVLPACGSGDDNSDTSPTVSLDGTAFVSTSVEEDGKSFDLAPGTTITITFTDRSLSANTGCNTINGGYQIVGGQLVVDDQLATTEMACDQDRMDQDQWFIDFLTASPALTQSGEELTLATAGTTINFVDEKVANPDLPLADTKWELDALVSNQAVSSVPAGVTSNLTFTGDGAVQGNFGCNSGGGDYEVNDDVITFGPMASTMMACPGDASDVEAFVLQVLDGDVSYVIDGSTLALTNGGNGLTYRGL